LDRPIVIGPLFAQLSGEAVKARGHYSTNGLYVMPLRNGSDHVCLWQILLKKPFWGDERKFLEPLMRLTRGDVRDHIALAKIDDGPS
jgi:hypothetical protein